jgi:hypothetical protein
MSKNEGGIDYFKVFKVCVGIMLLCIAGWAILIHFAPTPR